MATSYNASAQDTADAISLEAAYTGDLISNHSGGLERGTVALHNFDLVLSVDGNSALHWPGSTFFVYGLGNIGGSASELAGDAQGLSNIEAPEAWKVYEAWLEKVLFDGRLSVLAGLYDLNSEFDALPGASLFIHSSHGIGPDFSQSGRNGPSIFPTTSLGLRARLLLSDTVYLQSVILDGVAGNPDKPNGTHIILEKDDGWLLNTEIGVFLGGPNSSSTDPAPTLSERIERISRNGEPSYRTKIALGIWSYSSKFENIVNPENDFPAGKSTSWGVYALAESRVMTEPADTQQGMTIFGRVGVANGKVNRFSAYTGAGAVYTGLIPGRNEDQLGVGIAIAHNGEAFRNAIPPDGDSTSASEFSAEISYLFNISSNVGIQAGIHAIANPDTNPNTENALLTFIRLYASL